jgi:hypothetical protein
MSTLKNSPPNSSAQADSLPSPEKLDGGVRLLRVQLASAFAVPEAIWEANLTGKLSDIARRNLPALSSVGRQYASASNAEGQLAA